MRKLTFPEGFIWGTATAAYQIEGAYNEDDKGESIWDRFSHIRGNILNGHNGDIACDHYHKYEGDIKLLKELGIKNYRLSIAWTRIFPDGKGEPNPKGIEFYKKLINFLIQNDIKPAVTIYHWDLPQKLQDIGGWANPEVVDCFEKYSRFLFSELGDLVDVWITHNEPWVAAFVGNAYGGHAPGLKDFKTALLVAHNLMLSHGRAVKAYREMGLKGKIGITLNLSDAHAATEKGEDILAANINNGYCNRWFLDPVLKGKYPEDMMELFRKANLMQEFPMEDLKIINEPIDFLGINYYSGNVVKYDEKEFPFPLSKVETKYDKTDFGWDITPEGLYETLIGLHKDYNGVHIVITENGAAFQDMINREGKVEDDHRLDFLYKHLEAAHRAIENGVNLDGYFVWSFMDNFEWSAGYTKRFGIVYVDYDTQRRVVKKSGKWYSDVIKNNGFELV